MSLGAAAEGAARRTGLPKATCMTLLEAGWTLIEDIKEPTRWVQPDSPVTEKPKLAEGGIVHGGGALVGHQGPGLCAGSPFFPGAGPAAGAGAISIAINERPRLSEDAAHVLALHRHQVQRRDRS